VSRSGEGKSEEHNGAIRETDRGGVRIEKGKECFRKAERKTKEEPSKEGKGVPVRKGKVCGKEGGGSEIAWKIGPEGG